MHNGVGVVDVLFAHFAVLCSVEGRYILSSEDILWFKYGGLIVGLDLSAPPPPDTSHIPTTRFGETGC